MLTERVSFTEKPETTEIEKRPDKTCRVILRANIAEETLPDEQGTQWFADEAEMKCGVEDCPTEEEIAEDFDGWFDYASEWKTAKVKTLYQLQADVDYIATMTGVELEV